MISKYFDPLECNSLLNSDIELAVKTNGSNVKFLLLIALSLYADTIYYMERRKKTRLAEDQTSEWIKLQTGKTDRGRESSPYNMLKRKMPKYG